MEAPIRPSLASRFAILRAASSCFCNFVFADAITIFAISAVDKAIGRFKDKQTGGLTCDGAVAEECSARQVK
jgi:hypothetical protein